MAGAGGSIERSVGSLFWVLQSEGDERVQKSRTFPQQRKRELLIVIQHKPGYVISPHSLTQGDPSGWLKPPVDLVPTAQASSGLPL